MPSAQSGGGAGSSPGRKSQGPGTVGAEEASACVDASVEVPSYELAIPQQLAVQIQEGQ